MSQSDSQLQSLLEAVERLLAKHAQLNQEHLELKEKLKKAEEALSQTKGTDDSTHNLSTPTPPLPPLNAEELDAMVEEIDACIALLKS